MREVRALKVQFGGAGGRGDAGADHAGVWFVEGEDAGDGEVVGEVLKIHRIQV